MRLKISPATGTEGRSRTKRPRISRARAGSLDAKDIAAFAAELKRRIAEVEKAQAHA